MAEDQGRVRWTQNDVEDSLQAVREELLAFLKARTRLDWFKHKLRWRLSRKYIWPGAPAGSQPLLDERIERDGGVEAFVDFVRTKQASISGAIERYNLALRRFMEQERGVRVSELDEASRRLLKQRRITFQGTRDELLRRARELGPESGSELIPELLSLRLAILSEEARDEVFAEVAAIIAEDAADADADMSIAERDRVAEATRLRLRQLDQYHVARLLAENYAEARRMMALDEGLKRYEALRREAGAPTDDDQGASKLVEVAREVLLAKIAALEVIFPMTAGSHERERRSLRDPTDDGSAGETR